MERRRVMLAAIKHRRLSTIAMDSPISTGILADAPFKITVQCKFITRPTYTAVVSTQIVGTTMIRLGQSGNANELIMWYGSDYASVRTRIYYDVNTEYNFELEYKQNNISLNKYANGTVQNFSRNVSPVFLETPILIGMGDVQPLYEFSFAEIVKTADVVYRAYPVLKNGRTAIYDEISDTYTWL